jgi:hypothetical protein
VGVKVDGQSWLKESLTEFEPRILPAIPQL